MDKFEAAMIAVMALVLLLIILASFHVFHSNAGNVPFFQRRGTCYIYSRSIAVPINGTDLQKVILYMVAACPTPSEAIHLSLSLAMLKCQQHYCQDVELLWCRQLGGLYYCVTEATYIS